jgi:hypothetical protein
MQWISCHEGRLLTQAQAQSNGSRGRSFRTGLAALDALAPESSFAHGAIHELLSEKANGKPLFVGMLLVKSILEGAIIWSDPHRQLYPPALSQHGVSLDRLYLLHPKPVDQVWAITECLRCKGVGAVVAAVPRLTRVEARRLQLAAECGGGVGILLRPADSGAQVYAAATRWLVRPAPGERTTQRWDIQLLHGHGGRVGQTVTLEYCRENHLVRALETVADRPDQKTTTARGVARAS